MTKKTTSAGVIITDGAQLLIGHVTNHAYWDIPKGQMDPGESALAAAQRECEEETGIQIPSHELRLLGLFDYKPKKNLVLYVQNVPTMPDPASCVCKSKFKNARGIWEPELDAFKLIKWHEIAHHCQPALVKLLEQVKGAALNGK